MKQITVVTTFLLMLISMTIAFPAMAAEHGGHGGEGEGDSAPIDGPIYVRMDPVTAPVYRKNRVRYYIFLTINLLMSDAEAKAEAYKLMPKLRDAFLRELHGDSILREDGPKGLDLYGLKKRLMNQARKILGAKAVSDVLITNAIRGG